MKDICELHEAPDLRSKLAKHSNQFALECLLKSLRNVVVVIRVHHQTLHVDRIVVFYCFMT